MKNIKISSILSKASLTAFLLLLIYSFLQTEKFQTVEVLVPGIISNPKSGDIHIPSFKWPPPRASAMVEIPEELLLHKPLNAKLTLGDIGEILELALWSSGYLERTYFQVPTGFALVTRIEQINSDGSPKEVGRWSANLEPLTQFSLQEYLKHLLFAKTGLYRVVVFIVSSNPFSQTNEEVIKAEAMAWLAAGLNRLPPSIAIQEYGANSATFALVYEFEVKQSEKPKLIVPSNLTGLVHLRNSGILGNLGD